MAIAEIDVINLGIALYGGTDIASKTANTKSAKLAKKFFQVSSKATFELPYDWRFATHRLQLAQTTAPSFGSYSYQYLLPSKYVRLIHLIDEDDDEVEYPYRREIWLDANKKERPVFLSNETTAYIRYIRELEVGNWPMWFARLVALDLSMILVAPVAQDKVQKNLLLKQALDPIHGWLAQAIQANGLEDVDVDDNFVDKDKGNDDVIDAGVESITARTRIQQVE